MGERGTWSRNPGDLPPALAEALERCPTCGVPWPTDVEFEQRSVCEPARGQVSR